MIALAGRILIAVGLAIAFYAYFGYPILLRLLSFMRSRPPRARQPEEWPRISITIPAYNEERAIGGTIEAVLAVDYPADRRQVLIVSDCSTDRTDEIVRSYADRGVELVRMPTRGGKTKAENAVREHLTGEIVVNTDASVRIAANALKPLIAHFSDPEVGVASGRDVSVARIDHDLNVGESGYVGYEMWVRDIETRVGSIVGASGCFYAIRRGLHQTLFPEALSRDFASALIAHEAGYRAVSVNDAVCFVPRIASLRHEFRRKVRTLTRALETLWYKRNLMNPLRHGLFAWMLLSHKLIRWVAPWGLVLALAGWLLQVPVLGGIVVVSPVAAGLALAAAGWYWPADKPAPRLISFASYLVSGIVAALIAWKRALRGELNPVWEPTRRDTVPART